MSLRLCGIRTRYCAPIRRRSIQGFRVLATQAKVTVSGKQMLVICNCNFALRVTRDKGPFNRGLTVAFFIRFYLVSTKLTY